MTAASEENIQGGDQGASDRLGICPFLSLRRDPESAAAYPRSDHRCKVTPGIRLSHAHQRDFCTSANHVNCLNYLAATRAGAASPVRKPARRWWILPIFSNLRLLGLALLAALLLTAAGVAAWTGWTDNLIFWNGNAADDDGVAVVDTTPTPEPTLVIIETPDPDATPSPEETPTLDQATPPVAVTPEPDDDAVDDDTVDDDIDVNDDAVDDDIDVNDDAVDDDNGVDPTETPTPVTPTDDDDAVTDDDDVTADPTQPDVDADDEHQRHVVQPGDTLASLSELYDTTPGEIAALNQIAVTARLQPGTVIILPTHEK